MLLNEEETLNVIFLDSYMPNMGGIEACKQIRQLGYTGVIIAISGNVIPEDIEEFLAAGADKFLGKPITLEQLQKTIQGIVTFHFCNMIITFFLHFSIFVYYFVVLEFNWRILNPYENSVRLGWYKRIANRENGLNIKSNQSYEKPIQLEKN